LEENTIPSYAATTTALALPEARHVQLRCRPPESYHVGLATRTNSGVKR
jgi:hypothetical protein